MFVASLNSSSSNSDLFLMLERKTPSSMARWSYCSAASHHEVFLFYLLLSSHHDNNKKKEVEEEEEEEKQKPMTNG